MHTFLCGAKGHAEKVCLMISLLNPTSFHKHKDFVYNANMIKSGSQDFVLDSAKQSRKKGSP